MAWQGMDPEAAANKIRDRVDRDIVSKVAPDDQHRLAFIEQVCRHLGMEPRLPAIMHVREVLEREGVMQLPPQYPKMLTNDEGKPIYDESGNPIVFETEADETAYAAAKKRAEDEKIRAQEDAEEAARADAKSKKKG